MQSVCVSMAVEKRGEGRMDGGTWRGGNVTVHSYDFNDQAKPGPSIVPDTSGMHDLE